MVFPVVGHTTPDDRPQHATHSSCNPFTSIFTVPSPLGGRQLATAENGVAGAGVDHFLSAIVYGDDSFQTSAAAR